MLSLIKGVGNVLGLRRPSSSSSASAGVSVSSPEPGRAGRQQQKQKTAIRIRRVAGEEPAANADQQQQSKSVRFSGQLEDENVAVQQQQQQQSPPPRPPLPQKLQSQTSAPDTTNHTTDSPVPVEDYDNLQGSTAQSLLAPVRPASEQSITNCSDCCEQNEESLNTTDFSEHINSEQYPSLELSNQQGVRHVTSNFDRLPYQGAYWLMQQQQIDEEQRLVDMKQLQEEQEAEELRLYMEEAGVHENMKLHRRQLNDDADDTVCCQVVRPIAVEPSAAAESYDNEPSTADEHRHHPDNSVHGEREAEEKAAVTIQRVVKGHCVRSKIQRQKTAAMTIQAHVKGFLTRKQIYDTKQRSCPTNDAAVYNNSATSAEQSNLPQTNSSCEQAQHCCSTMQALRIIQSSDSFYDLCSCCCPDQPASSAEIPLSVSMGSVEENSASKNTEEAKTETAGPGDAADAAESSPIKQVSEQQKEDSTNAVEDDQDHVVHESDEKKSQNGEEADEVNETAESSQEAKAENNVDENAKSSDAVEPAAKLTDDGLAVEAGASDNHD